jgi:repressor LexA
MGSLIATRSLPPVQRETLEFLRSYVSKHGYAPPLKEIARAIGVKSNSTAHFHLERLEEKGFIKRGPGSAIEVKFAETGVSNHVKNQHPEGASLKNHVSKSMTIPLVGSIAAGVPMEAVEDRSFIDIPSFMVSNQHDAAEIFALEVCGDSMIEAHICDGDVVVVKRQLTAENGDIVVALLEDRSATLKTFRRLRSGKIMLIPANSRLLPLTLDNVEVQGRVVGLIRKL